MHQYKKHNLFHYNTETDNIYLKLRLYYSKLKADEYKLNFVQNSKCLQCNKNKKETVHHYFMDCSAYDAQRLISKQYMALSHKNTSFLMLDMASFRFLGPSKVCDIITEYHVNHSV